ITLAPRSWPSRPGFAITTRIFFISSSLLYSLRVGPHPHALSLGVTVRAIHSNLRADVLRRLPTVALAKVGRRFGWQAAASLGPQALFQLSVPSHRSQAGSWQLIAGSYISGSSSYSPHTSLSASHISPTVA